MAAANLWFIDCKKHGPHRARAGGFLDGIRVAGGSHGALYEGRCPRCRKASPARMVRISDPGPRGAERCMEKCLKGKHVCRCRCAGLCHGAGRCFCGGAKTDAP